MAYKFAAWTYNFADLEGCKASGRRGSKSHFPNMLAMNRPLFFHSSNFFSITACCALRTEGNCSSARRQIPCCRATGLLGFRRRMGRTVMFGHGDFEETKQACQKVVSQRHSKAQLDINLYHSCPSTIMLLCTRTSFRFCSSCSFSQFSIAAWSRTSCVWRPDFLSSASARRNLMCILSLTGYSELLRKKPPKAVLVGSAGSKSKEPPHAVAAT